MNIVGILFVSFVTLFSAVVVENALTCLDEEAKSTDWFVIYKLPKQEDRKQYVGQELSTGLGYLYYDHRQEGVWKMPTKNISSSTSALGRTVQRVFQGMETEEQNSNQLGEEYSNEFNSSQEEDETPEEYTEDSEISYLIYNDQPPDGKAASSFGHTKGIVAFDGRSGIWLIHSVPGFPQASKFEYPDSAKENGQSIICVTVKFSSINLIGEQLLYNRPKIYAYNSGNAVKRLKENVQSLFSDKPLFVKKSPWSNVVNFTTRGRAKLWSFAKHAKFEKDLYDDLVAPSLKVPLFVETWRRGSGTIIPSTCNIKYIVQDVTYIDVPFMYQGRMANMAFSSKEDHSKWAISSTSKESYVCIGDLNRMESQKKRGGGTLCMQSPKLWRNFRSAVNQYDEC